MRDFLTSRRARITPQQAGLPEYGGKRRVPGLRRSELATLAGISVEYLTQLERGNVAKPLSRCWTRSPGRCSSTKPNGRTCSTWRTRPAARAGPPDAPGRHTCGRLPAHRGRPNPERPAAVRPRRRARHPQRRLRHPVGQAQRPTTRHRKEGPAQRGCRRARAHRRRTAAPRRGPDADRVHRSCGQCGAGEARLPHPLGRRSAPRACGRGADGARTRDLTVSYARRTTPALIGVAAQHPLMPAGPRYCHDADGVAVARQRGPRREDPH